MCDVLSDPGMCTHYVTHLRHQRPRNSNGQSFVLHVMTLTKILMLKIDMFYFSPTNFPLPRVWAGVRIFVINDSFRISSHRCGHGMSLESTGNQKNLLRNCQAHCVTHHPAGDKCLYDLSQSLSITAPGYRLQDLQ